MFCSLLARCAIPCACHAKPHLNLLKVVRAYGVLTFWHGNVLRATTACNFSTSQLRNVVRDRQVFTLFDFEMCFAPACNFSSLIWPDGSAPAALASLLFDPPEPPIIGKTQRIATFLPFRAPASSFLWLFLFSDLLSSSPSSLTLPTSAFLSVHIVGSLTSKLPSTSLYTARIDHFWQRLSTRHLFDPPCARCLRLAILNWETNLDIAWINLLRDLCIRRSIFPVFKLPCKQIQLWVCPRLR